MTNPKDFKNFLINNKIVKRITKDTTIYAFLMYQDTRVRNILINKKSHYDLGTCDINQYVQDNYKYTWEGA